MLSMFRPFLILDTLDSDTDPRIGVAFYWDREILLNNIDLDASSKSWYHSRSHCILHDTYVDPLYTTRYQPATTPELTYINYFYYQGFF